jgi:hypothetical protein
VAYTYKYGDQPIEGVTVQRAVGRGGFGEVYYALLDSGKQVAVKYLKDNAEVELRGIGHVLNLKSPHLITIYDVKRNEENEPFVLMEYVSGPSLRELLLAEPNGLGAQKAAFFLSNIAKGLSYLHERGIVHRDLKPGNIFYDDGYVKIGDYGLSKHIAVSKHSGQTVSVGTVHYMAPEIGSGSYTKAIDIYALGVILYETLTGRLPFTGSSMGEILMRHLRDRPDLAGIPEPFHSVIRRALAKDPAERFQDVNEMVDAIVSADDVSASIASFDPSVLNQVQRRPEAADPERTITTPGPRRPEPLDVHDAGGADLPLIPPIPPMPGERAARRAEKGARRLQRRAERWREWGQRVARRHGGGMTISVSDEQIRQAIRGRGPQIATIAIVGIGASILLGLLSRGQGDPADRIAALAFLTAGGVLGPLVAHYALLSRLLASHAVLDRFVVGAAGAVFMIPGIAIAVEEVHGNFPGVIVGVIAALVLCDWRKRIEVGQRGKIEGGAAFTAALVGFIGAAIGQAETNIFVAAGLCAAMSFLVQAAAALKVAPARLPPRRPSGQPRSAPGGDRTEAENAASCEPCPPEGAAQPASSQGGADQGAPDSAAPPREVARRQKVIDPAQPSFVGRAASAGMGLLAKLLLLVGFVWAFSYGQKPLQIKEHDTQVIVGGSRIAVIEHGRQHFDQHIPQVAVLAPFVLGALLLVASRRYDGVAHFLRGCLAACLAIVAACIALGPARESLAVFFSDWDALTEGAIRDVVSLGMCIAAMVVLMSWPKKRRGRPIVI